MDLPQDYIAAMDSLTRLCGTTHAMMHVHIGLAIYLGVQFLLRDRRASYFALMTVLFLELLNEAIERLHYGSWRWEDTLSDIALSTFWPAAITALGRYRRHRWHVYQLRRLRREAAQDNWPASSEAPPSPHI